MGFENQTTYPVWSDDLLESGTFGLPLVGPSPETGRDATVEPAAPIPESATPAIPAAAARVGTATERRARRNLTDDQLVALAQNGDVRAFELLVVKYQHKVVQTLARIVGEGDAPDVAQETFIKVYRAIGSFRGNSAFFTWLYRIAINTAKNHLMARRRRPIAQDIDVADAEQSGHSEFLSDCETPENNLLSDEIKYKVTRAIHKLPGDLRQAIVLRELVGLSYEEIAEIMKCPVGTVRSRIFRAREAIDTAIKPLLS